MSKSLAVNLKTFVNAIVSRCRYTTGTDLETRHKQQLFNYLVGKSIALSENVINIKTAINILKKFYLFMMLKYLKYLLVFLWGLILNI